MLTERDFGRNIRSSRQSLGMYLDHWLDTVPASGCAKCFRDYGDYRQSRFLDEERGYSVQI